MILYHLPVYMDGGLLDGTEVSASIDEYLYIQDSSTTTFMALGVLIVAINIFVLTKSITAEIIKRYKQNK